MQPRLRAAATPIPEMTAMRFFQEILPPVLRARAAALAELGGTFAFIVRGEGSWILDLGAAAIIDVEPGERATAALAIELDASQFTQLMKGKLDVKSALAEHHLVITGNVELFPNLAAALGPSA